ncbi:MAG: hypothetical protein LQ338_007242 [Usnochroma carphineum]|nr:MAG: hypothetical protein LQ338_007242 [Usnochroma carphineum]
MAKQKKPKSWAEEVADLDDPAPRDFDPEAQDGDSGVGSSEDDAVPAREHYVDVGNGRLRKSGGINLGPEYSGSHISRNDLLEPAEVSDDDPFASAKSPQESPNVSGTSDGYANPEDFDLDMDKDIDQDDEIDRDGAFGNVNKDGFQGTAFQGSRSTQVTPGEHDQANGHSKPDEAVEDGDSADFSAMDSEEVDVTEGPNGIIGGDGELPWKAAASDGRIKDAEDVEMEDQDILSSEDAETETEAEASGYSNDSDSAPPPTDGDRATLRKLMAESHKVITSNLSKAAKSDIAKGHAIKHQRTTFDSLLNTRIRLQKALIATNSFQPAPASSTDTPDPAIQAAEQAALRLWSTLDSLRQSLHPVSTSSQESSSTPAPPIESSSTTPLSTLWTRMQSHETHFHPHRTSTLNKWSAKTAPLSSLTRTNKLLATPIQQPLSAVLQQQLDSETNMEKLIAKTRVPRSCAPIQAAAALSSSPKETNPQPNTNAAAEEAETSQIYDDTPFYSLLLRDLVSARSSDPFSHTSASGAIDSLAPTITTIIPGVKDRVHKKKVDTKASKGRKIRYTVHEKLQNFMAPEDRGTWGERQREELVRGLLGRKVDFGAKEAGSGGRRNDEGELGGEEEEGLRLFR